MTLPADIISWLPQGSHLIAGMLFCFSTCPLSSLGFTVCSAGVGAAICPYDLASGAGLCVLGGLLLVMIALFSLKNWHERHSASKAALRNEPRAVVQPAEPAAAGRSASPTAAVSDTTKAQPRPSAAPAKRKAVRRPPLPPGSSAPLELHEIPASPTSLDDLLLRQQALLAAIDRLYRQEFYIECCKLYADTSAALDLYEPTDSSGQCAAFRLQLADLSQAAQLVTEVMPLMAEFQVKDGWTEIGSSSGIVSYYRQEVNSATHSFRVRRAVWCYRKRVISRK